MKSSNYRSVSLESDLQEERCDDHVDMEGEESRLARRRCFTLFTIVALFLVSAGILLISVVQDVQARASGDLEWEEFSCQQNDVDCLTLLCPEGMEWNMTTGQCKEMEGIHIK